MNNKVSIELVNHRLEQAENELEEAILLYKNNKFKGANSRAYYSIFHSVRAVLALEPIDFKKHKDIIGYFNKNYIHTEIFPKKLGHKISEASKLRDDSDYDDYYDGNDKDAYNQISTAKEVYNECKKYVKNKIKSDIK